MARPPCGAHRVGAVVFRLLSAVLAFLTNLAFPDYIDQRFTLSGAPSPFWDAFIRHDSGWYFQIARNGFHYTPGGRDTIAFFDSSCRLRSVVWTGT